MKYDRIIIFTKSGNLLKYLQTARVSGRFSNANAESVQRDYGAEREIQLVACLRCEDFPVSTRTGYVQMPKYFCKIKCPVNPLPVKGEFELPSLDALYSFLKADGWKIKQSIGSWMFK